MYSVRILSEADQPVLDAFLLRHADEAMLLRGNLKLAGVEDRGERFQGPYAGAFDAAGALRAVAVHYWRGTLCAVADEPEALDPALRATVARSARVVTGFVSPRWIVTRARRVLGFEQTPVQTDKAE